MIADVEFASMCIDVGHRRTNTLRLGFSPPFLTEAKRF